MQGQVWPPFGAVLGSAACAWAARCAAWSWGSAAAEATVGDGVGAVAQPPVSRSKMAASFTFMLFTVFQGRSATFMTPSRWFANRS